MNDLARFKSALRKGGAVSAPVLHKEMATRIVPDAAERSVKFTISTGGIDRQNDTIAVEGWDLASYLRNPVVLWGHDALSLPIARCLAVGVEDGELRAVAEFVPADMPVVGPLAEAVLRMCREGYLSATSVGFRPLEFKVAEERDDGEGWFAPIDFIKSELLEFSVVGVPANGEALIDPTERLAQVADEAARAAAASDRELASLAAAALERSDRLTHRRLLQLACV